MPSFQDQLGRSVFVSAIPKRIIAVVPSQTELLHYFGLDEEVIGITKFCVHPAHWFQNKVRVGGTKKLNIEKIRDLQPDLIIANKEENTKEQIDLLSRDFPVWISDVNSLADACQMIHVLGEITGRGEAAIALVIQIQRSFEALQSVIQNRYKAGYFIWKDSFMVAGGATFINDILNRSGFDNIFEKEKRYPVISIEELVEQPCDIIFLSSEPYPFQEKHVGELEQHYRRAKKVPPKIFLVDGELFSWYGNRLLFTSGYVEKLHKQLNAL